MYEQIPWKSLSLNFSRHHVGCYVKCDFESLSNDCDLHLYMY